MTVMQLLVQNLLGIVNGTLTFENSTNFDKFQEGDELGSPAGAETTKYVGNNAELSVTGLGFSGLGLLTQVDGASYDHQIYDNLKRTKHSTWFKPF